MIQLGLRRAAQLFSVNAQPWHAVHIAGTNGKGTVCAYLSALLHSSGVRCGRFTSPHLIDRWDCITIDEQPVSERLFGIVEAEVLQRNKDLNLQATEFELLTATAFDIFTRENVQVGIVEVGMGGRDDATNILKSKALTIITRIGLDHQKFLGDTVEEIAQHKCGIFKEGVPVIYSPANTPNVVKVIKREARNINAGPVETVDTELPSLSSESWETFKETLANREQQRIAINQAHKAWHHILTLLNLDPTSPPLQDRAATSIIHLHPPGRLQTLGISHLIPTATQPILLDGAHNAQAAENLSKIVDAELRPSTTTTDHSITWIIANTRGRDIHAFLAHLLHAGDRVIAVEFSDVQGMPWVKALPAEEICAAAREVQPGIGDVRSCGVDIIGALREAVGRRPGARVVATGSLYFVSDVLRVVGMGDGR